MTDVYVKQVQTKLADDIDSAGMEAQYDKNAKKLLVHKNILSWILKECVEEYKELSPKEIEECIEGTLEISKVNVHRDTAEMKYVDKSTSQRDAYGTPQAENLARRDSMFTCRENTLAVSDILLLDRTLFCYSVL